CLAPAKAMQRLAPGRSGEAAAAHGGRCKSRGQGVATGRGVLGRVLPGPAQNTVYSSYPLRTSRSAMLEVLKLDYVRTARAKGLREHVVIIKHALKNAAIPIATVIGLQFGVLLAGAGGTGV